MDDALPLGQHVATYNMKNLLTPSMIVGIVLAEV
jgi:hypothetical protein